MRGPRPSYYSKGTSEVIFDGIVYRWDTLVFVINIGATPAQLGGFWVSPKRRWCTVYGNGDYPFFVRDLWEKYGPKPTKP